MKKQNWLYRIYDKSATCKIRRVLAVTMMIALVSIATSLANAQTQQTLGQVTFTGPTEFEVGRVALNQATGDLNGDLHLDLAVANREDNDISILFGDGIGGFGSRLDLSAYPAGPIDVLIAYLNKDTNLDLAVLGSAFVSIFLGNGTGGFGARKDFFPERWMTSIATDDLNGDTNLDLVIGTENSTKVILLFGNGTGGFSGKTTLTAGIYPRSVDIADINKDGNMDVVTSNQVSDDLTVFFGNGSGGFPTTQSIGVSQSPLHLAVADLNNDSNPDILVTNTVEIEVLLGVGNGTFLPPLITSFGTSTEKPFTVDDFNEDGNLDILLADTGFQRFLLCLGAGDGSLTLENFISTLANPFDPIAGDFNEDGLPDVALTFITNSHTSTVAVYLTRLQFVDAGGPYSVNEGGSVLVTASGNDPGPLTYAWDLDNNGSFETPGQSVDFSAANLDGPSSYTIKVQVTDNSGLTAIAQATVNVLNVAPTATLTSTPNSIIVGQSATLAFSNQFDPSAADVTAGFTYSYDCTNDGTFEISDVTATASYSCPYSVSGTFTANGRIKDKDGGFIDYTVQVVVQTPQEAAVQNLIDQVIALNKPQGNGLIGKLEVVIKRLDNNEIDKAIEMLQQFIKEVNKFIDNGIFTSGEGQPLIDAANRIIAALQTGLPKLVMPAQPTEYLLGQNYPNPFNPSTTISFALPRGGEIMLAIYNLRGQLVKTLVSGALPAGHHEVMWDGTDSKGTSIATGVYLSRLEAKDFVATRKLLLTK